VVSIDNGSPVNDAIADWSLHLQEIEYSITNDHRQSLLKLIPDIAPMHASKQTGQEIAIFGRTRNVLIESYRKSERMWCHGNTVFPVFAT